MIFKETKLKGVFIIEPEILADERGFFARVFCRNEFENRGIDFEIVQSSISYNRRKGTLRGMHWQAAPKQESKLVRCTKGAIYDVVVDINPASPTYGQWISIELNSENRKTIYVPEGFAHGFQTLEDDTEVFYQMNALYAPEYARTVRWNDPSFKIKWPLEVSAISEKDRNCLLTAKK